ncbi:MAG: TatD family hydrolase [Vicinamibacteria bacterium]|jgi:TatD DNase family protein|nr:TatD family hydrolase [Vicinamibacteria bacterium]MBP9948397.1 TatD family hydrolase [Vicinamibacteria bacterium]
MRFADSHTHIDLAEFDSDRPALLKRAAEAGVVRMLLVAQADDSVGLDRGLTIARDCGLKASGGLHPHEAICWSEVLAERLETLGETRSICAIGEIGLDFHYDHSPRDQQEEVFRRQIRIARSVKLPVIIHTREADDLTVKILREEKADEVGGVIHCFTGTQELADAALALGFSISFSGIACFANADPLRAVAKTVPMDRFLVETDCPFLAPPPHRGKRNEPAFVVDVARRMAEVKGVTLEELGETTVENFDRLFGN